MFRRLHITSIDWKAAVLLFVLLLAQSFAPLRAQNVMVTVSPVQPILPPQVLLYIADPGKYFTIQLSNNTGIEQNVYLQLDIEHVSPSDGLRVTTPNDIQPLKPIVVPAHGVKQLTTVEMNALFDHIPEDRISCPAGLFDDYRRGAFGLLPEGLYRAHIVAYSWANPQYSTPVVASNPEMGQTTFTVCYKAQAPIFLPMAADIDNVGDQAFKVGEVMQFNWTIPTIACGATSTYNYDFRVVEVLPGQQLDDAMDHNPTVYQVKKLVAPTCILPQSVISAYFKTGKTYLAQVVANPTSTSTFKYVMMENEGKSGYRRFHIVSNKVVPEPEDDGDKGGDKADDGDKKVDDGDKKADDGDDDEKADDDDDETADEYEGEFYWGDNEMEEKPDANALYSFRNPEILTPVFNDYGARKLYIGNDINCSWKSVYYVGGEGENPNDCTFTYEVKLFKGDEKADKAETLLTKPIITKTVTNEEDLKALFTWAELEPLVQKNDYMVLQIVPKCTNQSSVAFINDEINVVDFAMIEHLYKKYFECSNQIVIENTKPTTKTAADLRGKKVTIGEYTLTIDSKDFNQNKDGSWKGKGKIEWNPMGTTVMVCVKFDNLKINTDDQVYEGECQTYAKDAATSDLDTVEQLFSDWGIDKYIGDSGLPYASAISASAKSGAKDLAKAIDLSKYYGYVQKGQAVYNLLGKGNINELYFPVALPDVTNQSPVQLQISTMKFAPTHATMDLIGEFTLPNSSYLKNDILVFGAPRLCISPDNIVPESGTIALLSDFTIKDPKSSYEMTFKCPEDLLKPSDGCYISWHDYAFEMLGVDIDMKIPGLVKDVKGEVKKGADGRPERPIMNIRGSFSDWDDWLIDQVNIDDFQAEDLPGWTFQASDIVYDHSLFRNSDKMGKFPAKYDKKKAGLTGLVDYKGGKYSVENDGDWTGLYVKTVGVRFPKAFEFGSNASDKRLKVDAKNMFFDKSGATMSAGVYNAFKGETGKLGGWSFSLDEVTLNFIQSNFDDCKMKGKIGVPLIKTKDNNPAKLAYNCQIRKALKQGKETENTAYIFTIQQMDDEMNIDMFLAKASFERSLTYFAVEAETTAADTKTRVELLMGGNLRISGSDWVEGKIKDKIKIDISIPDIHFSGLRIANCAHEDWASEYAQIKGMQTSAFNDKTKTILTLYEGKTFNNASKTFFFSTGAWSLASMSKKVGPFEFSLEGFDFESDNNPPAGTKSGGLNLKLGITGKVKVVEGIDISAAAKVFLKFSVYNLTDITNVSATFNECTLDSIGLHTSFCGITLDGSLKREDNSTRKGFAGKIKVVLPGDLFGLDMKGGYYEEKATAIERAYSWGYFVVTMDGKAGVPVPPVQINGFTGGFYFNCSSSAKNPDQVTPKRGKIGIILGMKLSTIGADDIMSGDFTMTVIYDKNRDGEGKGGLTQFLFVGTLDAVGGLIHNKMTILYENTQRDEYFQLTITSDSKLDNVKGLQELNSSFEKFDSEMADLANLEKAESESSSKDKAEGDVKTNNAEQKKTASLGSVSITLDVKITRKVEGRKLDKVKWHVYLGEPTEDKRCKLVLIDFKSKIVTVKVGANAYICVGNELPNDGQLPPIPDKIAKFLDGSDNGSAVSDGIGQADAARSQATANFGGSVVGGVMFGAQVYGYIDVNLGIITAGLDALAGFDVSLRKLSGAVCTNTNGHPGWNEWYGQGQLYAYFAAWLNLHINLGFYKKDLEIANAAIGGVLNMGGPNPTYFDGKLRAKISALGGLIKLNKKFSFTCGNKCELFLGNPLDNFILWDYCSLGDTIQTEGWNKNNAIEPYLSKAPYVNTSAPLEQHFRVLDENEYQRIVKDYSGDAEKLKMEAERTFVFRAKQEAWLYTYEKASNYNPEKKTNNYSNKYKIEWTGGNPTHHILNLASLRSKLEANKFYRLELNGCAYELKQGREVDPVTFDEKDSKYKNTPWKQTKNFFFCTGEDVAFADTCDLEKFVAIAYPSNYNRLHDNIKDNETGKYMKVYLNDAQRPTIALTKDISGTAYRSGKLYWRVLNEKGLELQRVENAWVKNDRMCNMEPRTILSKMEIDGDYIMSLDYATYNVNTKTGAISSDTLNIGRLHVHVVSGNWRTGYQNKSLPYEVPFVGAQLKSYAYPSYTVSDTRDIALGLDQVKIGSKLARNYDPFLYIGYLSNFAFIGGWETDRNKFNLDITTTQSAVMRVKGAGNYEGAFGSKLKTFKPADDNQATNIWDDKEKIRNMFFYDQSQYQGGYGYYPVPAPKSGEYDYLLNTDERAFGFYPSSSYLLNLHHVLTPIKTKYKSTQTFATRIQAACSEVDNYARTRLSAKPTDSEYLKYANEWMQLHRGTYLTCNQATSKEMETGYANYVKADDQDNQFLSLPYYQIGFSGGAASLIARLHWVFPKIMKKEHYRACEDVQLYTSYSLQGISKNCNTDIYNDGTKAYYKDWLKQPDYTFMSTGATFEAEPAMALLKNATFKIYRVNAYDFETGNYTCTNLLNGSCLYQYDVKNPLTSSASVDNSSIAVMSGNGSKTSEGEVTGASASDSASGGTVSETNYRKNEDNLVNYRNQLQEVYLRAQAQYETGHNLVDRKVNHNAYSLNTYIQNCLMNAYYGNMSHLSSAQGYYDELYGHLNKEISTLGKVTPHVSEGQGYLDAAERQYAIIAKGASAKSVVRIEAEKDIETCRKLQNEITWYRNEVSYFKDVVDSLYADAGLFIEKIDILKDPETKKRVETVLKNLKQARDLEESNYISLNSIIKGADVVGTDEDLAYMQQEQKEYKKSYNSYLYADDREKFNKDLNNGNTHANNVINRFDELKKTKGFSDSNTNFYWVGKKNSDVHRIFNDLMALTVPGTPAYNDATNYVKEADEMLAEVQESYTTYRGKIDDMEVIAMDAADWKAKAEQAYAPYGELTAAKNKLKNILEYYFKDYRNNVYPKLVEFWDSRKDEVPKIIDRAKSIYVSGLTKFHDSKMFEKWMDYALMDNVDTITLKWKAELYLFKRYMDKAQPYADAVMEKAALTDNAAQLRAASYNKSVMAEYQAEADKITAYVNGMKYSIYQCHKEAESWRDRFYAYKRIPSYNDTRGKIKAICCSYYDHPGDIDFDPLEYARKYAKPALDFLNEGGIIPLDDYVPISEEDIDIVKGLYDKTAALDANDNSLAEELANQARRDIDKYQSNLYDYYNIPDVMSLDYDWLLLFGCTKDEIDCDFRPDHDLMESYESRKNGLNSLKDNITEAVQEAQSSLLAMKAKEDDLRALWEKVETFRPWIKARHESGYCNWSNGVLRTNALADYYEECAKDITTNWDNLNSLTLKASDCMKRHQAGKASIEELSAIRQELEDAEGDYRTSRDNWKGAMLVKLSSGTFYDPDNDFAEKYDSYRAKVEGDIPQNLITPLEKMYADDVKRIADAEASINAAPTSYQAWEMVTGYYRYVSEFTFRGGDEMRAWNKAVDAYVSQGLAYANDVEAMEQLSADIYRAYQEVETTFKSFRSIVATQAELDAAINTYEQYAADYRALAEKYPDIDTKMETLLMKANTAKDDVGYDNLTRDGAEILANAQTAFAAAKKRYADCLAKLSLTTLTNMDKVVNTRK